MTRLLAVLRVLAGSKALLMPALMLLGAYSARRLHLTPEQFGNAAFGIFAVIVGILGALHDLNAGKLDATKTAVDENAKILDRNTPKDEKPLTVEAARKRKAKP